LAGLGKRGNLCDLRRILFYYGAPLPPINPFELMPSFHIYAIPFLRWTFLDLHHQLRLTVFNPAADFPARRRAN